MKINTKTRLNQVKTYLREYIVQNHLKRNDRLPSEASIAKTLGVSRNTLREAYISLENEGIIIRRHGLGTFVAQSPVIRDSLNEFSPFAQMILNSGYKPAFRTLSMAFESGSKEVCDVFRMPPGSELRIIKRLVYADKQPVIYVEDYVSPAIENSSPDWSAFDGNMVRFLDTSIDTPLHQIQSRIRAGALRTEIAPYLEMPARAPVLSVRSTIYTVDNKPVNYSILYFNSNIIELHSVRIIRTN